MNRKNLSANAIRACGSPWITDPPEFNFHGCPKPDGNFLSVPGDSGLIVGTVVHPATDNRVRYIITELRPTAAYDDYKLSQITHTATILRPTTGGKDTFGRDTTSTVTTYENVPLVRLPRTSTTDDNAPDRPLIQMTDTFVLPDSYNVAIGDFVSLTAVSLRILAIDSPTTGLLSITTQRAG